ncbi:MAG TPA: glycosyl hydrolase [Polyangia bacterium]|nr:glycosyl hydrolase [Polyangia bacterium]
MSSVASCVNSAWWSGRSQIAALVGVVALAHAWGCGGDSVTSTPGTGGGSARGGSAGGEAGGTTGSAGTSGGAGTSGDAGTTGGAGTIGHGGTTGSAGSGATGAAGRGGVSGMSGSSGGAGAGGGTAGAGGATATGNAGSGGGGGGGRGGRGGTTGAAGAGGRGGTGGGGGAGTTGVGGGAGAAVGMQPYKGVANSPCAARTILGVTWYYNWAQTESEPCSNGQGGQFVPMIWGHTGNEQSATGIANSITSFVNKNYAFVLGFNEPDNTGQSDIPVATAISLWPSFDNPAIKIGTPGTAANQNPGQAWFTSFMTMLNANTSLRADFMAIHWYGWNAGSCNATASELESYIRWAENFAGNRPIWITEFGCLNQSAPDVQTVTTFFNGAVAMFAKHPRVVRYAWYPWATNHALVDSSGALTALGTAFAAAPAYK